MTENAMQGDWDRDFGTGEEQEKGEGTYKVPYMKFSEAGEYRVRLVGKFVKFKKHWYPISAITHDNYKNEDPAWLAGFYPNTRYAIHVFDRKDGNKLKILDQGNSIFKMFAGYRKANDINPAGKEDAPDFVITKSGAAKKTTYTTMPTAQMTALTEDEIETYKSNMVNLAERYKTTPLEEIKNLWSALPDEKKIKTDDGGDENDDRPTVTRPTATRSAAKSSTKPATIPSAPIEEKVTANDNSDDPFTGGAEAQDDNGGSKGGDSSDLF